MMFKGAEFSTDKEYRYLLWRIWDDTLPKALIIGLNPSTADENIDDPTVRRIIRLTNSWGFGGFYLVNLFGFITPYPEKLNTCSNPVGDNDLQVNRYAKRCDEIIFAWGKNESRGRDRAMIKRFPGAKCIGKNLDGSPKHPLYVRKKSVLISF